MSTIDTHATSAPASASAGFAGIAEWASTTDHKRLGRLHLGAAALAFLGAAAVAILLGIERVSPEKEWLDVGSLTQLFALERFALTFLVLLPLVIGMALTAVPLQVGARSLALPRVASGGFYAWLLGSILAVWAIVNNGGPGGGNRRFVDLFTLSLILLLVGLLASVVSLATTILTTRTPGMNLRRVPFFTWSVLVMSTALVVALPVLIGDLVFIVIAHRYPSLSELSGNRALAEWAGFGFTQPTTVLFALPVLGFLADVVATASGSRLRPRGVIFGLIAIVGSTVWASVLQTSPALRSGLLDAETSDAVKDLIPFVFVQGLPVLGALGVVLLSLKGLGKRPALQAPLVFGLLAAVLLLSATAANALQHVGDAALVGTTFEEGTWLAVVFAAVLAAMGAVTYWGPKWTGRTIDMKKVLPLGLLAFVGAELASLPLLIAGFADQPGAVLPAVEVGNDAVVNFSYSGPLELWNALSAVGLALVLLAVIAFIGLALKSARSGATAGDDPWNGQTLEWATSSPAPADNFSALHIVKSAEPLLDLKPSTRSDA